MKGIKLERTFERVYFGRGAPGLLACDDEAGNPAWFSDVLECLMRDAGASPTFQERVPLGHVLFIMGDDLMKASP